MMELKSLCEKKLMNAMCTIKGNVDIKLSLIDKVTSFELAFQFNIILIEMIQNCRSCCKGFKNKANEKTNIKNKPLL